MRVALLRLVLKALLDGALLGSSGSLPATQQYAIGSHNEITMGWRRPGVATCRRSRRVRGLFIDAHP